MKKFLILSSFVIACLAYGQDCQAGFRLFNHEYLQNDATCIPEKPERLAVLDLSTLEVALIHGVQPVAMYQYGRDLIARSNPNIHVEVMALTEDSADVGNPRAINLEALLEADPDVIVMNRYSLANSNLEQLQEIAPTLVFRNPFESSEYRASVSFMAELLHAPELAEQLLSQLDSRLVQFRDALDEQQSVSLVRLREAVVLFVSGSFADHLIHEAGLVRPEQQRGYDLRFVEEENKGRNGFEVSYERLPIIDADYIFIWTAGRSSNVEDEAKAIIARLQEDPLWQTLEAVQNDHLFVVGSHWQGFGIFEAHAVLDDLFRHIVGVEPQDVASNPFIAD